jgi:hypothetical protein
MYQVKIHPQNMSPDPRVPGRSWVQAARLSTRPEAPEERAGANVG